MNFFLKLAAKQELFYMHSRGKSEDNLLNKDKTSALSVSGNNQQIIVIFSHFVFLLGAIKYRFQCLITNLYLDLLCTCANLIGPSVSLCLQTIICYKCKLYVSILSPILPTLRDRFLEILG